MKPCDCVTYPICNNTLEHSMTDSCPTCAVLRESLEKITRERDREKERTDIVIAEFDAPWPHSHKVGDVVSDSLVWQIHKARQAVEDRATTAEAENKELRMLLKKEKPV